MVTSKIIYNKYIYISIYIYIRTGIYSILNPQWYISLALAMYRVFVGDIVPMSVAELGSR